MTTSLSIGKFAATANVGVETVRYYLRQGLLKAPAQGTGVRKYGEEEIRQLKFIRKAQAAGFTLKEIKELITLDSSHDHDRAYQLAMRRLEKLDKKITEMQHARDSLKKLAGQCAAGGKSHCCAILEAFNV